MDETDLKDIWKSIPTSAKNNTQLGVMIREANHPILRNIKKQLTIEAMAFGTVLFCYYSIFDGADKPALINIIFIGVILIQLLHNFGGYRLQRSIDNVNNVIESLGKYLKKIKHYAIQAICCRLIFAAGLLLFFSYNIELNSQKWALMIFAMLIFAFQLWLLYQLWTRRIRQLKANIVALAQD